MGLYILILTLLSASYGIPPPNHYPPPPPYRPISSLPLEEVFPEDVSFGVNTVAYNHEGAWNQDGKSLNVWDYWTHTNPSGIIDGSNGDDSADAYNLVEDDIFNLKNLSVRHYCFSLSWARLIPDGCGPVNKVAVRHYQRILQLLKASYIEPIVTIFAADLPQVLQDQGGFLSDQFPYWFTEYAKVVFDNFGTSVKYWITFHGPTETCYQGYGDGTWAPGISDNPGENIYICGHNILKAHADVYHLYDEQYRTKQKGNIAISLYVSWYEPASNCITDIEATERKLQFQIGWFAHAIYVGNYPQAMIDRIGQLSELQGLCESRLPRFTPEEIEWIKDTHDFFSLFYFLGRTVKGIEISACLSANYTNDIGAEVVKYDPNVASGLGKVISWITNQYDRPSILIAGNGFITFNRTYEDYDRIEYTQTALSGVRKAMLDHGARIFGYTHSYIDGFDWEFGYTVKRGLYDVDFDCPTKQRTPRKSADYYKLVCRNGCIYPPQYPRSRIPKIY